MRRLVGGALAAAAVLSLVTPTAAHAEGRDCRAWTEPAVNQGVARCTGDGGGRWYHVRTRCTTPDGAVEWRIGNSVPHGIRSTKQCRAGWTVHSAIWVDD